MDFVGGLPMYRKGDDYLYVFVDRFRKMCVLMPCKKNVTARQIAQMLFQNVWVNFGFPLLLFLIKIIDLLANFGQVYGNSRTQS